MGKEIKVELIGIEKNDELWKGLKKQVQIKLKLKSPSKAALVACPIVTRAGTDIEAARQKCPDDKPAVLVVFHYTFDPERIVPDSSKSVTENNSLIAVDFLCHEEKGLLLCPKNKDASEKVTKFLKDVKKTNSAGKESVQNQKKRRSPFKKQKGLKKYKLITVGGTRDYHEQFIKSIPEKGKKLKKVSEVSNCDFILVFCFVVTRAGTDIEAALQNLNNESATKPAVLVVLHHTFDADRIVPESSRSVRREKTIAVDCLFHEDKGLLQCKKNNDAQYKIKDWLKEQKELRHRERKSLKQQQKGQKEKRKRGKENS